MESPVESIRTPDGSHVLSSLKERGASVVSPSVAARLQRSQLQKYIGLVTSSLSRRNVEGHPFDMFSVSVPEFAPSFNSADPLVGGCSMEVLCSLDGNARAAVRTGNLVLLIGRLTARRVGGKPAFLFHATSVVTILELSLAPASASYGDSEPDREDSAEYEEAGDEYDARRDADDIKDRSRDAGTAIRLANDPGFGIDGPDEEDGDSEYEGVGEDGADTDDRLGGGGYEEDESPPRRLNGAPQGLRNTGPLRFRPRGAAALVELRLDTGMAGRVRRNVKV